MIPSDAYREVRPFFISFETVFCLYANVDEDFPHPVQLRIYFIPGYLHNFLIRGHFPQVPMGIPGVSRFAFFATKVTKGPNGGDLLNLLLLRNEDCSLVLPEVGGGNGGRIPHRSCTLGVREAPGIFLITYFDQSDG